MHADFDKLAARLASSPFRSSFHLDARSMRYVEEKGMDTIRIHARELITRRLAPADIPNDGRQTPMKGHPVFIAQHATATCCRGCLEKWHGIAKGRPLSNDEVCYVTDVVMFFIASEMERINH